MLPNYMNKKYKSQHMEFADFGTETWYIKITEAFYIFTHQKYLSASS